MEIISQLASGNMCHLYDFVIQIIKCTKKAPSLAVSQHMSFFQTFNQFHMASRPIYDATEVLA